MSKQISTITFFEYKGLQNKVWGFGAMQYMHSKLKNVPGQQLYKLLGSGVGDFSPWPDWSTYALLQVWNTEETADQFFVNSKAFKSFQKHSTRQWTLFMKAMRSKGTWSGLEPFESHTNIDEKNSHVCAITRATIKTSKLLEFWKYVPKSQEGLQDIPGLLFTKGVGEVPFKNMATFSLWTDSEALKSFAYAKKGHQTAIQKTRTIQWYSEELFVRFQPFKTLGRWEGVEGFYL